MVTVGFDLHKRYITACALDPAGAVLAEHRRLDSSLEALGERLAALPHPSPLRSKPRSTGTGLSAG